MHATHGPTTHIRESFVDTRLKLDVVYLHTKHEDSSFRDMMEDPKRKSGGDLG